MGRGGVRGVGWAAGGGRGQQRPRETEQWILWHFLIISRIFPKDFFGKFDQDSLASLWPMFWIFLCVRPARFGHQVPKRMKMKRTSWVKLALICIREPGRGQKSGGT